jgi:hypothetical protein
MHHFLLYLLVQLYDLGPMPYEFYGIGQWDTCGKNWTGTSSPLNGQQHSVWVPPG